MFHAGDVIGPYTLIRALGRGGFGEVWLTDRVSSLLTTQVALKLPLVSATDLNVIRQEARVWLTASGHPNIVPVLEAEVYDGQVVIASEYVAGGSLSNWLEQHGGKAASEESAVKMISGILAGLEHLHQNQLIHRDLKPDNVLLQSSLPRLTDFGLTRILKPSGHTTNISGTPGYMAPESFRGEYSPASDVWAAGMVLHELLVGSLPYSQTDFYSLLLAITGAEPVVLSDQIPASLLPVLKKALAKPVADRFASAAEMASGVAEAFTPGSGSMLYLPPGMSSDPANNLPIQATSFIGREKEIGEVTALLSKSRLLTLTGSGGCGKTRLALELTRTVLREYADGGWLVELAALSDQALVPNAVAQALGISEEPGKLLIETISRALKIKRLLLVLDNCEHLLNSCAHLVETLIHSCPNLRILASSREALNIAGELIYVVPSLSFPEHGLMVTAETVSRYESALLFIERATFHQPTFAVSNRNAGAVAGLCQRLDGIPLALELAAARVRGMPVEQIEDRLDDRFRLLTGGSRTALPRQQTLRSLIDWSYELLDESEKALLARLSVFAGGWTLAAAEKVCQGAAVDEREVLDLLTALLDKSLVVYNERDGTARYRLLETVRQYGMDKLIETGRAYAYQSRHRDYFLALAEEAQKELIGVEQGLWLERLEIEHDNLRAALDFCHGETEDAEAGLMLTSALQQFWGTRGYLTEGRLRYAAFLSRPGAQAPTMPRVHALYGAGVLALYQGDYAAARSLYEESLALARQLNDKQSIANALNQLGNVTHNQGDYAAARRLYQESLVLRRQTGDKRGIAVSLGNLGNVTHNQGDYGAARSLYEEGLALRRDLGDQRGIAYALGNLGNVAHNQSDYSAARTLYGESLTLMRQLGDKWGTANTLNHLGNLAHVQGDYDAARSLYEESLVMQRELGDKRGIAFSLANLGNVAKDRGDYNTARSCLSESLMICLETGSKPELAFGLECSAQLAQQRQQIERAVRLYGAARALREVIGSPSPPSEQQRHEKRLSELEALLGKEIYFAALGAGQAMDFEHAIEYALEESTLMGSPPIVR